MSLEKGERLSYVQNRLGDIWHDVDVTENTFLVDVSVPLELYRTSGGLHNRRHPNPDVQQLVVFTVNSVNRVRLQ